MDGGTGGYQGQVTVHIKGKTQCYECEEKPTPKTYPVCTIRSTPDKVRRNQQSCRPADGVIARL